MLISVVVPAYNEEELLADFFKEVIGYLKRKRLDYELILVENGSWDKTLEIAKGFAQKNKRIKVSHLSQPNYGKALLHGLKKAKGNYLVIFNVDYWDKRFIDLAKVDLKGADIIIGSKNLPDSRDSRPAWRRLVTKSLNLSLRLFFGFSGTDTHGIKTLRRDKILPILKRLQTKTGIFDTELMVRAQRRGLKILELPVKVIEKRPNRFGIKRIMETPKDLIKLYLALRNE